MRCSQDIRQANVYPNASLGAVKCGNYFVALGLEISAQRDFRNLSLMAPIISNNFRGKKAQGYKV
jgi:hypothetical protein